MNRIRTMSVGLGLALALTLLLGSTAVIAAELPGGP